MEVDKGEVEPVTSKEWADLLARVLSGNGLADQLGLTLMTPKEHAQTLQELERGATPRETAERLWGHLEPEVLDGMAKLAEEYLRETEPGTP